MQVFDEVKCKLRNLRECRQVVVGHIPGQVIIGYVGREEPCDEAYFSTDGSFRKLPYCISKMQNNLVYSNQQGHYMSKVDVPAETLMREMHIKGRGRFPYDIEKRYEACESFSYFDGKQSLIKRESYCLAEHLKYSFGLEFETSQGYVPQDICYRDGLIPLRDGSIAGIEYSTVVLDGNTGIGLLEQQLESLKKHTNFDKECSLHIHMGGFPLTSEKLFNLYILCKGLESDLASIVPQYTFITSKYKANNKDYCSKLPTYRNFEQMYEHLVGRRFFNDFTQPHPNDIRREAKWRIPTRYFWINFINALCYDVNKTIEFRFLRPTYNFQKIILWLYIFNGILKYAEEHMVSGQGRTSLYNIIRKVYPGELSERIILGIEKLAILKINQTNNGDYIGQDIAMEDDMFSDDLGI